MPNLIDIVEVAEALDQLPGEQREALYLTA